MAISHVFTNPVPDGTITSIVRPSDWNSAHNQYYTLSGNVLGASTVSGTNVVLQAGTNISLSGTGQTIVIQGTNTPQPTSYVSNVNGISGQVSLNAGSSLSASTNGSSITFGLASNITTALQSANSNYLTTQSVQTQPSGAIAGTGFTSTTTAGTAVTGALGTNGINLGIPAYLTTARASNDGVGLNTAQTNVTWTVNSGGISLNAGAYLTTARASNDGVGLNTAQTNVTWTVNSGGISLNAGAYLTTQTVQTQASGNIVGSGFTSTTTTGTAVVGTLNSSGLSLGVPAFLTAAAGGGGVAIAGGTQTATSGTVNFANSNGISFGMSGSNQITASYTVPTVPTSYVSNVNGSSGQISLNVGSSLSASTNGSSITFGLVTDITTALQSANANYLTSQSNQAFSASGGSSTFQTLNFANSNGVTFSNSGGSIVASYTVPTQSVQTQASGNIVGSGFTSTTTTGTAVVGTLNSSGLSLGVPAFITAGGGGGNFSGGVSNLGNTAGSTGITGTRIVFVGTNNISLSQSTDVNGATISFDQTGGGGGGAMYANLSGNTAGNTTASGNTLNFSGINVTLSGTNNSQIAISAPATTALVAGNNISLSANASTVTVRAQAVAVSAGSQLATSGTLLFSDANGFTFGMNGSSRITISARSAFSAAGGSSSISTLNFTASNGITFTNTNASVAIVHDLQFTSNTSAITANAFPSADTTKFAGTGTTAVNATVTLNSNGINISVAAPGGGGNFSGGVSNLGNTAGSTGITGTRIVFVGTNNISLSQSTDANGATISIDQTGGGGGAMYANLSGATSGNTTASGNTLNFSGINVTLSGTNASQIAISAPATSSLAAGNNISLSTNGSTIGLSAQAVAVGAGTQTATSGTIVFSNSNGISFGLSGSTRVTASYTQLNQAFSASGGSSSFQTLNFANSNGLTFSNSNGSVVASYTVPDTTGFAGTGFTSTTTTGTAVQGTLSTNGLSLAVPAFITAGGGGGNFSGGVSNLGNTAGSTGITGTRIVFVGTNNISLSQSTDANGATISINQTGGGGGGLTNINVSAGTTSNNLSNIVFSNTNGVSFGLNGSTVTASVAPQYTLSGYNHYNDVVQSIGPVGQGSLIFDHIDLENAVQFDRFGLMIYNSNPANSTGSHTVSFWVGLYTQNGSTISRLSSTSTSIAATQSGTVGSYSLYSGIRQLTIPFTTTLTQGEYYLAAVSSSSSAGANGTYSQLLQSNLNSDYRGLWGSAVNASNQVFPGIGYYSANTAGLPVSVAFSEIRGTVANAFRPPVIIFQSGTF